MPVAFDEKNLSRFVGSPYFSRGRSYWKNGRVLKIERLDATTISGKVRGSERKPYETILLFDPDGEIIDSSCTCPMESECKHVAALGFAALEKFPEMRGSTVLKGKSNRKSGILTGSAPGDVIPIVPEWARQLSRLAPQEGKKEASGSASDRPELQVLFRLERSFSSSKTAFSLELRPRLLYPRTGKKSLGDIRWAHPYYGLSFLGDIVNRMHSGQVRWFQQISETLEREGGSSSWASVDGTKASYFWHLLREAPRLGVEFFQGLKGEYLFEIDDRVVQKALVIADEKSGALSVSEHIFLDEERCSSPLVVAIGNPPVFAWRIFDDEGGASGGYPRFALHSTETNTARIPVQTFSRPLFIPVQDISVFVQEYLPKLAREHNIVTESDRVSLPLIQAPKLSVAVERGNKKQSLRLLLGARYGETDVAFGNAGDAIGTESGIMILRDPEGESRLRSRLEECFRTFSAAWEDAPALPGFERGLRDEFILVELEAARFLRETIPALRKVSDVFLSVSDDIPIFSELTAEPEIEFAVVDRDGENDWFNLNIAVKVEGESAPLPELLAALAENQEFLLLENGRYFSLHHSAFQKLRALLEESRTLGDVEKEGISVSRFQADFWRELSELGLVKEQADRWEKTMSRLLSIKGVALPPHPDLSGATLRPYQHEGFAWLSFLREHGLGGVLGDDMGLGKTIQAIALLAEAIAQSSGAKKQYPFIVVAPTSVVENWDIELERFAPHIRKVIMRSGDRTEAFQSVKEAQVIVTSYSLLVRDFERYEAMRFDTLILDEAQSVKNYQSKSYMNIRKLNAKTRLALTGTPMENNTMEFWSIFSIVAPGLFGPPEHFRETFQRPIEKENNTELLSRLRSRIRPFFLRRKKDVVAKELPPKTEQVLSLDMHPKHQKLYDLHLQRERQRVLGLLSEAGGMQKHRFAVFKSLMKMRRLSLHPGLIDDRHRGVPSVKLNELLEQVKTLASEGHKMLIFSQFTSFLAYVRSHLDSAGFDYLYLDGATKNRGELVRRFQADETKKIFLISLKAGGFGLNLTAADYCFILDPWWNPAVEMQAIDRAHRIGQTKNVFVYKMITKDTIEEKVLKLQQKKRALFDSVLEKDAEFHQLFTEKDVRDLFS